MIEQETNTEEKLLGIIRLASLILGIALIVIGAISLIYIALFIFNVFENPNNVPLINWTSSVFSTDKLFINGHFDNNVFEINISPVLQYLFYAILALLVIRVITSLINSFISSGIKLIQLAKTKK